MQAQLADYWWYEHLLSLQDVPDEVINHFGDQFPQLQKGNLPPAVKARLFLRHMRKNGFEDPVELLEALGFLRLLSQGPEHFRSTAMAAALDPPLELLLQVQCCCPPS